MGEWFQTIVDREASLVEAQELASTVLEFLINQGIIEAEMKVCGLDRDGMGYPPGHNCLQVVDETEPTSFRPKVNGLQVIVERSVFDSGQGGFELTCPQCQTKNTNVKKWQDAVQEWYDNKGDGLLECSHCNVATPVTDWNYESTIAFGNLGFQFWNWPPLKESFVSDIAQLLAHRTSYIAGKV